MVKQTERSPHEKEQCPVAGCSVVAGYVLSDPQMPVPQMSKRLNLILITQISTTHGRGPLCPNKWTVLKENDRDASSLKRAGYRALLNLSRGKVLNDGTDAKELKVVTIDVITDVDTARHVAT